MRRPVFSKKLPLVLLCLVLCGASLAQAQKASPADPRFEIRRYVIEGATLVSAEELAEITQPFTGKDKNFADVQHALEALEKAFLSRGYSAVQVVLPEQELEKGEVKFKVIEAKIGRVIVEGNKNFDEENIRSSLPSLEEGESPNTLRLAYNLNIANESPSKQTTVLLRGGTEEGKVDAVVRVVDESPLKLSLSLDNSGTTQTGLFRVGVGIQYSNLWNRDHVISMQYIVSPSDDNSPNRLALNNSNRVFIFGMSYHIPIYSLGDSIDISAGQSNVNSGVVGNTLSIAGAGTVAGIRYNRHLPRWGELQHKLALGADFRAYESRVTQVGGGPQLVPDVTVRPASLTYSGTYRTTASETNFYLGDYLNFPGTKGAANQDAFTASRAGADAAYQLQRYGISHNRSFANDMQFRASFSGQMTKDKLVAGEQWGVGGADSVRGFTEREVSNDYGYRGSVELYSPDFASVLQRVGAGANTRLRALAFYDWGHVKRIQPTVLEVSQQSIAGAGLGIRAAVGSSFFLRADWGVVIDPGGLQGVGWGQGYVSLSYLF